MAKKIDEKKSLLLFLAFSQKVESRLSAYSIWVLFRFIKYFEEGISSLSLDQLAAIVGVQTKKLRIVLSELEHCEILKIDFPESGVRARVRHIQLRLSYVDAHLGHSILLSDWIAQKNKSLERDIPLFKLVKILFIKSDSIRIGHSPEKVEMRDFLDYRCYLVLLRLLQGADSFGIVIQCGIPELEQATGLSQQSIYRAIQQLKRLGFIRSQANGAIKNSFIQLESPIYALNLSHTFWGDEAIYSQFYILQYPQPHVFEVQKVASLFTLLDCNNDLPQSCEIGESEECSNILKYKNNYLLHDPLCRMNPIGNTQSESYTVIQRQEVMKFIRYYLGLKTLHPENPLTTTFKLKPHENVLGSELSHLTGHVRNARLNGMHNRLGLFQSLLEQWCCRIYSQNQRLFVALKDANYTVIDDVNFNLLSHSDFLYPYQLDESYIETIKKNAEYENDSDKIEKVLHFKLKSEQSLVHQFLMAVMDLIAYNQIYFFQQCLEHSPDTEQNIHSGNPDLASQLSKWKEKITPFRILPRSFDQRLYSCIFVPDKSVTEDQYFMLKMKSHGFNGQSIHAQEFDFPKSNITKISPTVAELKHYGVVHPHDDKTSFDRD